MKSTPEKSSMLTKLGVGAAAAGLAIAAYAERPNEGPTLVNEHQPYKIYTVQPGDKTIYSIAQEHDNKVDPETLSSEITATRRRDNPGMSATDATLIQPGDQLVVPNQFDDRNSIQVLPEPGER